MSSQGADSKVEINVQEFYSEVPLGSAAIERMEGKQVRAAGDNVI